MPQVKLISPITRLEIQKTRVAAYCRVSTNSSDQQNSYANQVRVYTSLIQKNKEWELVEIFADEGLSGMKAQNRVEFQRMIKMCEQHKIDLIIAKSVSRFARNVKESLEYVRKLNFLASASDLKRKASIHWPWAMRCCSIPSLPLRRRNQKQFLRTKDYPS